MKQLLFTLFISLSISTIGQIPNTISSADKVYGLSRFWQEVNYNFVYLENVDRAKWDKCYKEKITKVLNTKNDYEYYRELQEFAAMLKDGHTEIQLPKTLKQMNSMFGDYVISLRDIDGKAIVVRTNLSKKNEIPFGSEVIEVNGKPTQQYMDENVAPYISASTDKALRQMCVYKLLSGMSGETYKVKIRKPDGKVIELTLTHKPSEEKAFYPPYGPEPKLLDFKWLNKQIAYVALNSFEDEAIDSLFVQQLPELDKAKALVVDLRNNGGGSTDIGLKILDYLTNDKVLYGEKTSSRLHIPAYKAWGVYVQENNMDTLNNEWVRKSYLSFKDKYYYNFDDNKYKVKSDTKKIVIPTVLLISGNTASAAEDFLVFADNQKHMIKIGESTFGSTGQPFIFNLPGGGVAKICTIKSTFPDGKDFIGVGIKPDIEIKSTLQDFMRKKDSALNKAVEYLNHQLKGVTHTVADL